MPTRTIERLGGLDSLLRTPRPEFQTGVSPAVNVPGLMTGLSGLGYWLAGIRTPVPDVLTLEP